MYMPNKKYPYPTSVNLTETQKKWVDENYFRLSPFVRKKLDELIEERSK